MEEIVVFLWTIVFFKQERSFAKYIILIEFLYFVLQIMYMNRK